MEELKSLADQLESQVTITLENGPSRFLVKLFSSWFLNRQELDDFMMVRINWMRLPEHLISFFDLVNTPEKFSFKDEYFNVFWVFLLCNF